MSTNIKTPRHNNSKNAGNKQGDAFRNFDESYNKSKTGTGGYNETSHISPFS
jgi:hypothetical protein